MMANKWKECVMEAVESDDRAGLDNLINGTGTQELDFIFGSDSPLTQAILYNHAQIA